MYLIKNMSNTLYVLQYVIQIYLVKIIFLLINTKRKIENNENI